MTPEVGAPDVSPASPVVENPWRTLRQFTTARIGLGRAGISQPTHHHLAFQLAHAQARDAVNSELDTSILQDGLSTLGCSSSIVTSAASDRRTYLLRPDLGRKLDDTSAECLRTLKAALPDAFDVAFVIADGLSANAVQRHALPVLESVIPSLVQRGWTIAPVIIVTNGRVAVADEIGSLLGAQQSVILIGERPGLSAPDSLGLYLTYDPRAGRSDAERNCISNVRGDGLSYEDAASTLLFLLTEARRRELSGVLLKNEAAPPYVLPEG
jgi:ethanolamine ammonia-lyase small subunit